MSRRGYVGGVALAAAALAATPAVEASIKRVYDDPPEPEPEVDNEGIPGHLSVDRQSRFYTSAGSYVGVRFNGEDVSGRVVEYSRDGGWVRLANVKPGDPVTPHDVRTAPKSLGTVETYWRMKPSRQIRRQLARIG